jgi:hypothetical protein
METSTKSDKSNFKVTNVKIEQPKHSSELKKWFDLIEKHSIMSSKEAEQKLPKLGKTLDFELLGCNAGFANGVRRILLDEVEVQALDTSFAEIKTDDNFISGTMDCLIKNITLVPIVQNSKFDPARHTIVLLVSNMTLDIMPVYAKDLVIVDKKDYEKQLASLHTQHTDKTADYKMRKGGEDRKMRNFRSGELISGSFKIPESLLTFSYTDKFKSVMDISELIPNPYVVLDQLRPGKSLYIANVHIVKGRGYQSASHFTLLDNIRYNILGHEPFDFFAQTGKRSIEYNPTDFKLGFTTRVNIEPLEVLKLVQATANEYFSQIETALDKYEKFLSAESQNKFYASNDLEVSAKEDLHDYKFFKIYLTPVSMIASMIYDIDPSISFVTASVERLDTDIGILRLKHKEPNKVIRNAIGRLKHWFEQLASVKGSYEESEVTPKTTKKINIRKSKKGGEEPSNRQTEEQVRSTAEEQVRSTAEEQVRSTAEEPNTNNQDLENAIEV